MFGDGSAAASTSLGPCVRGDDGGLTAGSEWPDAFLVTGALLGLPGAARALARREPAARETLGQRIAGHREPFDAAAAEAGTGQQVAARIREALAARQHAHSLEYCDVRLLAEAWRLDPSPEVHTAVLQLLAQRTEQERQVVEAFLLEAADQLLGRLLEPGAGLWQRLTGWMRLGPAHDAQYLALLGCIGSVRDTRRRVELLRRCASHPAQAVARRAALHLCLEAAAAAEPAVYRPALEDLAASSDARVRDDAAYALSLRPEAP